jgi:hypothetical protein
MYAGMHQHKSVSEREARRLFLAAQQSLKIPQKPLIFGPSMGIPSLNVYGRISAQEKHITTLDSSTCASRQDTQCAIVKTKGWGHCRGQTYRSLFQRQIYSQISKYSRKCQIIF